MTAADAPTGWRRLAATGRPAMVTEKAGRRGEGAMSIWGKIVGGAAGFALGGPLGALLGAVVGHGFDRIAEDARAPDGIDATKRIAFTIGVVVLGAKMAKADGFVSRDEVAAFREVFQVPPSEVRNVARIFNLARRDSAGFEPYARQIAGMFPPGSPVLEELLRCLFHIAKADGMVGEAELTYLRAVAGIFGFTPAGFDRIRRSELVPDAEDPYAVLGVPDDADDDTVRAAYRRLAREHHPDRLIADGMPEEFLEMANRKMAAINTAYDAIRRERAPERV